MRYLILLSLLAAAGCSTQESQPSAPDLSSGKKPPPPPPQDTTPDACKGVLLDTLGGKCFCTLYPNQCPTP